MNKFWNMIRCNKCTNNATTEDIKIETLINNFRDKFNKGNNDNNDFINKAGVEVNEHHPKQKYVVHSNFMLTKAKLMKYIKKNLEWNVHPELMKFQRSM